MFLATESTDAPEVGKPSPLKSVVPYGYCLNCLEYIRDEYLDTQAQSTTNEKQMLF